MSSKGNSTVTSPVSVRDASVRRVRRLSLVYPERRSIALEIGQPKMVLGREPEGPVPVFLDDAQASRSHASVEYVEGGDLFRIRDLDSKNGTFVGGDRIDEPEYLRSGAVVRIGETLLVYSEVVPRTAFDAGGPSLAFAHAQALADMAAPTDVSLLLTGPTGAGKEVLARRIHEVSGRRGRFVAVNCATFNRELVGSELFGHKRGAFSGASSDRQGLFVEANGGTLFLDEVAELPLDQQPILLRALQEKMIRPVGADQDVSVDVRVLAATHRRLDELEAAGEFREDLSARLAEVTIEVPGLADRREEILPLFSEFLGSNTPLTLEAAEALLLYDWPKNVRQLRSAATGAKMFAANAEAIGLPLLPTAIQEATRARASATDTRPTKEQLEALLENHGGNVARIARAIGKERAQIYRWLRMHGLDAKRYRD